MMDYRRIFYNNYNSKFKSYFHTGNLNYKKIKWFNYKILPFLKEFDKDVKIFEIGCGTGYFLEYLNSIGFKKNLGIDIAAEQIKISKNKRLNVHKSDVFDFLEKNENPFRVIVCFDFIEHFNKKELLYLTSLVHKNLEMDGIFIILTPNGMGLYPNQVIYGDLTHQTIFNPFSLEQLLRISNFKEIKFFESGPVPIGLKGLIKYYLWQIIKYFPTIIRKIETGKIQTIWTENMLCVCKK